jgi:hypothetical protein
MYSITERTVSEMKKKKAKKLKAPVPRPKKKADPGKPARRTPRQARLPGTEDPAIEELEALAEQYAEARDKQSAAGKDQKALRKQIAEAMGRSGKTTYRHGGVFITLLEKDQEVRVKFVKTEAPAEDEPAPGPTDVGDEDI